ncbi:MAG: hypothetical protein LBB41_07435 [Prevotellaceae bacterium]|nr:hypothetical protein [Prevotellaceae bacterium]
MCHYDRRYRIAQDIPDVREVYADMKARFPSVNHKNEEQTAFNCDATP